MSRSTANKPPAWPEAGVLLAALALLAAAASGLGLAHSAALAGAAVGVLVLTWLWRVTLRRAESAPALTWGQRAWNAVVFVVAVAALAGVAWWCAANARGRADPTAAPAADEQPGDAEQPEKPPRKTTKGGATPAAAARALRAAEPALLSPRTHRRLSRASRACRCRAGRAGRTTRSLSERAPAVTREERLGQNPLRRWRLA
jgi:hypothetical protein